VPVPDHPFVLLDRLRLSGVEVEAAEDGRVEVAEKVEDSLSAVVHKPRVGPLAIDLKSNRFFDEHIFLRAAKMQKCTVIYNLGMDIKN
jgi:hypothetical protein